MNRRLAAAGLSGLLIASLALTGCGQRNAEPTASGGGGGSGGQATSTGAGSSAHDGGDGQSNGG